MNAPVTIADPTALAETMAEIGNAARTAARILSQTPSADKDQALQAMADELRASCADILAANAIDMKAAAESGRPDAFLDRLELTPDRVEAMAKGLEDIIALEDPVGTTIAQWQRPNGLRIERVRTPLGVIGIIYESRPNVTVDAGGLALKSGNAVILRGGSDSIETSKTIERCLHAGLEQAGLPPTAIQIVPTTNRDAVGMMLTGLDGQIDIIIPRGGKSLVERVQAEARVPVFAHLEGICHVYVHTDADVEMARDIVLNSKLRRTGICGAAETMLVDEQAAQGTLAQLVKALLDAGCEVRGDEPAQKTDPRVQPATEQDWSTEYLDSIISVRQVADLDAAADHIATYGSQHTETIVTNNQDAADQFSRAVDSAIILHNASTQFADGGEFGMGAEIGIATGKMHARGPVGVEQLTSFKYVVHGTGQIRPA